MTSLWLWKLQFKEASTKVDCFRWFMVSGFDCQVWQTLCVSFPISITHWNNGTLMRSSHSLKFPSSEAKYTVVTISHASHTRKSAGLILESSRISMGMTSKHISLSWGIYSKSKPKFIQKHIKWLNHHITERQQPETAMWKTLWNGGLGNREGND